MAMGLVGRKCGMTRVFTDTGESIPVTVIQVTPNRITQLRTDDTDGYRAVQITVGEKHKNRLNKPEAGHFAKAKVEPGRGLWEFRLEGEEGAELEIGNEITVEAFAVGQKVDVTGISKGRGFAGTIKRHNFRGQRATHGNSLSHRVPGSIGQNQSPGRVFKGKKMYGHMGDVRRTVQNLEVVRVDVERHLVMIKGAVPGSESTDVIIMPSTKQRDKN